MHIQLVDMYTLSVFAADDVERLPFKVEPGRIRKKVPDHEVDYFVNIFEKPKQTCIDF